MAKKSMIQREIKRKCLVNRFSKKRKIVKQKLRDIMFDLPVMTKEGVFD